MSDITFFLNVSSTYGIHYLMKLIFVQLKVLHVPLNVSRLMILSATSNVMCFLLCIVFTMSTCMFYNYSVCRSTVSALCALLSCSAAICQMIMSMWLSIWTNKWWWMNDERCIGIASCMHKWERSAPYICGNHHFLSLDRRCALRRQLVTVKYNTLPTCTVKTHPRPQTSFVAN